MKKTVICLLAAILLVAFAGCAKEMTVSNTVERNMKTYYEMSDGSWMCDGLPYKYRLEISGRMTDAAVDSTFVYLSNREEISFEQAWKASGLSSYSGDYFPQEEAVLVELLSD